MKITIYELLGMIIDGKAPKKIKVTGTIYDFDEEYGFYFTKEKDGRVALGGKLNEINLIYNFNNENNVEIIEENKKELHANNIEFNINNDKRDCIITLDENDLGIDKLHLDNCYFYKENDKWYVKHINLKPIAYISQEHKIPEKIKIPEKLDINLNRNDINAVNCYRATNLECDLAFKINEILDYLEKME